MTLSLADVYGEVSQESEGLRVQERRHPVERRSLGKSGKRRVQALSLFWSLLAIHSL